MVRAIRDGRKTQTRRVMKPQPTILAKGYEDIDQLGTAKDRIGPLLFCPKPCKYGKPGDTLWVRETWCQGADDGRQVPLRMATLYRADGEHVTLSDGDGFTQTNRDGSEKSPWRPSIHMPRWASRITLRITDIRVERLQDISEEDAEAEGLTKEIAPNGHVTWHVPDLLGAQTPCRGFRLLWEGINGFGAWDENPWVWAISFERVKP
jgi:hypothetical protein